MPFIIILLLAILVAQFGFWDTLSGILGGIGILILVILTGIALVAVAAAFTMRRYLRRNF